VQFTFDGEVIHWRGPAPWFFVPLPDAQSDEIAATPELSYGWGCVPARVRIGGTSFETALMPKDGQYLVPVKVAVRKAEGIEEGDVVAVELQL